MNVSPPNRRLPSCAGKRPPALPSLSAAPAASPLLASLLLGLSAALFVSAAPWLQAQNTAVEAPAAAQVTGYPVTGRVICADTQRAARFAGVTLISAAQDDEGGRGGRASARTDLDGNFLLPNVTPGDYYVTAQLTGYVNEAPLIQTALQNAQSSPNPAVIPASVPRIRVTAGGASALLSLQRGGVISGTVQWDDGSPAAGVGVATVAAPAGQGTAVTTNSFGNGTGFGGGAAGSQTDDRGHFRLSGIPSGAYLVRAAVQAPAPAISTDHRTFARNLSLNIYAPDKLRRTDAAVVTLAAGEERNDLAITMKLSTFHSVSGTVSSTSAPVRSGSVTLTDTADSTLNRTGTVNADGSFLVPYVPPGSYTLRANVSATAQSFGRGNQESATPIRFQPLQESLTVADGDLTGLALTVTVASASSTTP